MRTTLHTWRQIAGSGFLFAVVLYSAACSGSSALTAPTPPPAATPPTPVASVAAITVTSGTRTNSTIQLSAKARMTDGSERDVTSLASWESSSTAIATIAGGLVTVVSDGDVDIRASYQGVSGSMHLTVSLPRAHTLTGFVTDGATNKAIAGVRVQVVGGGAVGSDDHGSFALSVTGDRALVEFSKEGYQILERDVTLSGDVQILVSLTPMTQQN